MPAYFSALRAPLLAILIPFPVENSSAGIFFRLFPARMLAVDDYFPFLRRMLFSLSVCLDFALSAFGVVLSAKGSLPSSLSSQCPKVYGFSSLCDDGSSNEAPYQAPSRPRDVLTKRVLTSTYFDRNPSVLSRFSLRQSFPLD